MALFQLYTSIFISKNFFSKSKKRASKVAFFCPEKIVFFLQRISVAIWGLVSRCQFVFTKFKVSGFRFTVLGFTFYKKYFTSHISHFTNTISLILVFITIITFAQSTSTKPNPKKIGLVLSGGGAKGFAHIGVLKLIEQAGIKIDYITGTSMGAVIGSLYASGYNATQIDSIFKQTNFDALLQDYIPRTSKNFYEKRNDELYAFSLPINNFKIGVPIALSKGLYNYSLLNQLFKHQRHITNFSKLPIPFGCVATDIETGQEVVLNSGFLPQAILASSAFPTLFSPVEIDGKLLIDGGVTNNYPVELIRQMGAEIVIGVDVQDDLKSRSELKEATRIMVQITNLRMIEKMKGKIALTDIYIKPEVSQYGVISFNQGEAIIKKGEEATFIVYDQLLKIGNPDNVNSKQPLPKFSQSLDISNIQINNLSNYTRSYIIGKLGFTECSIITYNDLTIGINKLNATQNFSSIHYKIIKNNKNENVLDIKLAEMPNKTFLKLALHYDDLYKTGVLINLTRKKNFLKNDVLSLDLVLGDNFRYNFDYYVDNGFYWSYGLKSKYNNFNRNLQVDFSDGIVLSQTGLNSININFTDLSNQVFVQTFYKQKFLVGLGLEHKNLKIKSATLSNAYLEKSDYVSAFGSLKFDSFDNKYFPTKGVLLSGDFQTYLYSSNFTGAFYPFSIAKADVSFAKTFLAKFTIKSQTEAGLAIGNRNIPFFNFVLGGYGSQTINNFKQFYGYNFFSISGDSFIKTLATVDYQIFKKNHINFSANYAYIQDNLFETTKWISTPRYTGYAFGYGLESVLGPIELKYSWSPEQSRGFIWTSIGFWF